MSKLFLYYSLTGNGDLLSESFLKNGYEIRKVIEKKKMPKKFFFRVLVGGFRAGMHLKGKLINFDSDVSSFEEIVIGSPVWNGRFPPAINSVLKQVDLTNKKVTFLFYSGSGEQPKVTKWINHHFPQSNVVVLKEPKKHSNELEKTSQF